MNPTAGGGLVRVSCLRSPAAGYAERSAYRESIERHAVTEEVV